MKLVAFEGIDGSGKSSVIKAIVAKLQTEGVKSCVRKLMTGKNTTLMLMNLCASEFIDVTRGSTITASSFTTNLENALSTEA